MKRSEIVAIINYIDAKFDEANQRRKGLAPKQIQSKDGQYGFEADVRRQELLEKTDLSGWTEGGRAQGESWTAEEIANWEAHNRLGGGY